jgi:hypothetical protein
MKRGKAMNTERKHTIELSEFELNMVLLAMNSHAQHCADEQKRMKKLAPKQASNLDDIAEVVRNVANSIRKQINWEAV